MVLQDVVDGLLVEPGTDGPLGCALRGVPRDDHARSLVVDSIRATLSPALASRLHLFTTSALALRLVRLQAYPERTRLRPRDAAEEEGL